MNGKADSSELAANVGRTPKMSKRALASAQAITRRWATAAGGTEAEVEDILDMLGLSDGEEP